MNLKKELKRKPWINQEIIRLSEYKNRFLPRRNNPAIRLKIRDIDCKIDRIKERLRKERVIRMFRMSKSTKETWKNLNAILERVKLSRACEEGW